MGHNENECCGSCEGHHHDVHTEAHPHVVPDSKFRAVFIALLVLTAITVGASYIHFENHNINLVVSMLVASSKGLLVALFFMHLKYENPVTYLYAIFPLVLLFFLLGGVFIDNPMRGDVSKAPHATSQLTPLSPHATTNAEEASH